MDGPRDNDKSHEQNRYKYNSGRLARQLDHGV